MKKDKIIFEHLRHSKFDIDKFENVKNNTITNIKDKPIDGGFYLFTEEEMQEFIKKEPKSAQYFR